MTGVAGVPSGWNNNDYWSSTPSPSGHAYVGLDDGYVYDYNGSNSNYIYAAYRVL